MTYRSLLARTPLLVKFSPLTGSGKSSSQQIWQFYQTRKFKTCAGTFENLRGCHARESALFPVPKGKQGGVRCEGSSQKTPVVIFLYGIVVGFWELSLATHFHLLPGTKVERHREAEARPPDKKAWVGGGQEMSLSRLFSQRWWLELPWIGLQAGLWWAECWS